MRRLLFFSCCSSCFLPLVPLLPPLFFTWSSFPPRSSFSSSLPPHLPSPCCASCCPHASLPRFILRRILRTAVRVCNCILQLSTASQQRNPTRHVALHHIAPSHMPPPCIPHGQAEEAGPSSPDVRPAYEYTSKKELKKVIGWLSQYTHTICSRWGRRRAIRMSDPHVQIPTCAVAVK